MHTLLFSPRSKRWQRGMGSHRIASFLREHGWDAEVIDYVVFWELEQLKELTRSRVTPSTIFFGFSTFYNVWTDELNQFTKWLKEEFKDMQGIVTLSPQTLMAERFHLKNGAKIRRQNETSVNYEYYFKE
jgi:hypothetical protein